MSASSHPPSTPARTELETVVNWPLLLTAVGLGVVILAVPAVLACVAGCKGDAVKDEVVSRREVPPADAAPVATSHQPLASYTPPTEGETPLPVFTEGRSRNKPAPIPPPSIVVVKPRPAPDPILPTPKVEDPPPRIKRLDGMPESALLRSLAKCAKDVDLESVEGTRAKLLAKPREGESDTKAEPAILALRAERGDLQGLPLSGAAECRASADAAKIKQDISLCLRRFLSSGPRGASRSGSYSDTMALRALLTKRENWFRDDGLPTLVQMLEADDFNSRRQLIESLAGVKGPKASQMLARRALFEFTAELRTNAIRALSDRPHEEYRRVLLEGLRYPWAPVAAHAAEVLVGTGDHAAVPNLIGLLDEPDPSAPARAAKDKWVVAEVVRINHLRNCLLCHAPSFSPKDPLRGVVPTPGQPLPRMYYTSRKGDFVRADVTYLRQDFSLMERVAEPDKWPEWQRFDYVVRTRELTADERAAQEKKAPQGWPLCYPQRDAVLFALRELTGLDAGDDSAGWYELLCCIEAGGGP